MVAIWFTNSWAYRNHILANIPNGSYICFGRRGVGSDGVSTWHCIPVTSTLSQLTSTAPGEAAACLQASQPTCCLSPFINSQRAQFLSNCCFCGGLLPSPLHARFQSAWNSTYEQTCAPQKTLEVPDPTPIHTIRKTHQKSSFPTMGVVTPAQARST